MAKTYNLDPIKQSLSQNPQVLILIPQEPQQDAVAAALTLYLSLAKKGLTASVGCSTSMTVNFNRLFGVDKIKQRIGNQNLVISFDDPNDALEKVAYDKDAQNQKVHLTLEPRPGFEPLDSTKVEYSYTGSNADLIFVIGARNLEDLGTLYAQEKSLLDNKAKTLVNLSHLDKNAQFGTVNLYDPEASGCSEIVYFVLQGLELPLEQDMATNLLAGIESTTNNLATASSPDTYEVIAQLLRLGAKKGHLNTFTPRPMGFGSAFGRPANPGMPTMPQPFTPTPSAPAPLAPTTQAPLQPAMPQPQPSQTIPVTAPVAADNQADPSPDWLKPKVFKSSNI